MFGDQIRHKICTDAKYYRFSAVACGCSVAAICEAKISRPLLSWGSLILLMSER